MKFNQLLKRYWMAVIVAIFVVVLLTIYIVTFRGGISNNHTDWGNFGNFFGSLTGLLAFIGVIITVIQSRHQTLASEERETFFSLLDIFREHRKNVVIEKAKIEFTELSTERKKIENEYVTGDIAFRQIAAESNLFFLKEILKEVPATFDKNTAMTVIPDEETIGDGFQKDYIRKRKKALEFLYFKHNLVANSYSAPIISWDIWEGLSYQLIQLLVREKRYDVLSYGMMRAGDTIYSFYKNQLGPYHRNIFYAYDTIAKFKGINSYTELFRAQLSKDELIVIFFNSFSIESSPKTREYFLDTNIFNNLSWNDVWINRPVYYIDQKLLKCLYKEADVWYEKNETIKNDRLKELLEDNS